MPLVDVGSWLDMDIAADAAQLIRDEYREQEIFISWLQR